MFIPPLPKKTKFITSLFACGYAPLIFFFLFSAEAVAGGTKTDRSEPQLSMQQEQARIYRQQGLQVQNLGDLRKALAYYQKAVELDPAYAIAYNDLGIIYEANGELERAENSYLQSIKTDPNFLSAYSNLALFYETKRDLDKAAYYWKKRADLGLANDPWTEKARARCVDIGLITSVSPEESKERQVLGLIREVEQKKEVLRKDTHEQSRDLFTMAKESFKKGEEVKALSQAIDAHLLDPKNKAIDNFIEKVQKRLLTR